LLRCKKMASATRWARGRFLITVPPRPKKPPPACRAETELYPPVKALLEAHGYLPKGEIRGCDIVATGLAPEGGGDAPLLVVEMKRAATLAAVIQAVDRFALTDLVYLALPSVAEEATPSGRGIGAYTPGLHRLCRRLGLGLIAVEPARVRDGASSPYARGVAVPVLDPAPSGRSPRRNAARAALVRREHARRAGDPNHGGTPGGVRLITAYRQEALRCAAALRDAGGGPLPVHAVREAAGAEGAGRILYRNVYGWFEPVGRDAYCLTETGARDLEAFGERALPSRALPPEDSSPGPHF
jgi:hypothetical protein